MHTGTLSLLSSADEQFTWAPAYAARNKTAFGMHLVLRDLVKDTGV